MNRRVILIAAGASVLITAAWYLLLFSPGRGSLADARSRRDAAQTQADTLGAQVRSLEAAKKTFPALQANLEVLRKAVPDTAELDGIISTVNEAAKGSGVNMQSIAPAPPAATPAAGSTAAATAGAVAVPAGALTEIPFTVSAKGTYFQLNDFVHRLSVTPRLIVVDNLSLTGQNATGEQSAGISGRMFVANKAAAAAAATPAAPTAAPAGGK